MKLPVLRIAIVLIAAAGHLAMAAAQSAPETWRCGNTYTDQPCKGGKAVTVDDARSEADRRAADTATRRAELRGDQLERSRLRQEKEAAERDHKAAVATRRAALAERRMESAERLQRKRIEKMDREPRKASARFKGALAGKKDR